MKPTTKQNPAKKSAPVAGTPEKKNNHSLESTSNQSIGGWFSFLFKPLNILFGVLAIIFLMWCKSTIPAYKWVQEDLLKGGVEYCGIVQKEIDRRSQSTQDPVLKRKIAYDTKYEAKVGINYIFLKYIRENTPENAVILFPPDSILVKKTNELALKGEIQSKTWVTHFLYPRLVVYEREKGKNPYYEKAQYIILMYGWGYDHLEYKYNQRSNVEILPIHKLK